LFAPGIGHLLLGQHKRALAWLGGMVLALGLAPLSFWFLFVGVIGVRIGSVVDLWISSRGMREVPSSGNTLHWPFGFFVLAIALTMVARGYWLEAFKIPSAAMVPTLQVGDHIMVSKMSTAPARGDVVVFVYPCEPIKDFVKRIVALEGDTVEVRCDQLYVNGEAVKREELGGECSYMDLAPGGWQEELCTRYVESTGGSRYEVIHGPEAKQRREIAGNHDFPDLSVPSCQNSFSESEPTTSVLGQILVHDANPGSACTPSRSYKVPAGHFFVLGDNRDNSSDSRVWGAVATDEIRGKFAYVWWSR
jgi:signal peptidase I